jgi:hypothetical protein
MSATPTPPIPEAIRRIADSGDRHLAWQFFVFFSRFEYALKRHPEYLKRETETAEPNWDRFSSDHDALFQRNQTPALQSAVDYFKIFPPRKQIQIDRKLTWSEPKTYKQGPILVWLLLVVRVVRNNLFHGGKFPMLPVSDPSRDLDLISHAIVILDACLMLDPSVQENFYDGLGD